MYKLVFFEISILMIILIHKGMVLLPLRLIDVDVEVLSNVYNVVVLNWLPVVMHIDAWAIIIVIVLNIISNVCVLVVWEVLLVLLEVSIGCAQMGVAKVHLGRDHWLVFTLLFLFQGSFVFNWVFDKRYLWNSFILDLLLGVLSGDDSRVFFFNFLDFLAIFDIELNNLHINFRFLRDLSGIEFGNMGVI